MIHVEFRQTASYLILSQGQVQFLESFIFTSSHRQNVGAKCSYCFQLISAVFFDSPLRCSRLRIIANLYIIALLHSAFLLSRVPFAQVINGCFIYNDCTTDQKILIRPIMTPFNCVIMLMLLS